jgi:hypothetical protein
MGTGGAGYNQMSLCRIVSSQLSLSRASRSIQLLDGFHHWVCGRCQPRGLAGTRIIIPLLAYCFLTAANASATEQQTTDLATKAAVVVRATLVAIVGTAETTHWQLMVEEVFKGQAEINRVGRDKTSTGRVYLSVAHSRRIAGEHEEKAPAKLGKEYFAFLKPYPGQGKEWSFVESIPITMSLIEYTPKNEKLIRDTLAETSKSVGGV